MCSAHSSARSTAGSSARGVLARAGPPGQLGDEHDEQRGGVDGAVVAARLPPSRLALNRSKRTSCRIRPGSSSVSGSVRRPWVSASSASTPSRECVVDGERHPTRQQRVSTEQRHEPRGARLRRRPDRGGQDRRSAVHRDRRASGSPPRRATVVRRDPSRRLAPARQPGHRDGVGDFGAAPQARLDLDSVGRDRHLQADMRQRPPGSILNVQPSTPSARSSGPGNPRTDTVVDRRMGVARRPDVRSAVDGDEHGVGQRDVVARLHVEDVAEIGIDARAERRGDGPPRRDCGSRSPRGGRDRRSDAARPRAVRRPCRRGSPGRRSRRRTGRRRRRRDPSTAHPVDRAAPTATAHACRA